MEGASGFWSTFILPTFTEDLLGISWFVSNSVTELNREDFTLMLLWRVSLTWSIAISFFPNFSSYSLPPMKVHRAQSWTLQKKKKALKIKNYSWGFPGGAVVDSLPANTGDTGSILGLGRSHMPWSNWAREPQLLSLRVWSLCSATREAATVRGPHTAMKSGPCSPQLEKALAQKWRPNTAKNK